MTVAELIEELQKMPQDLDVYIYAYGEEKEAEEVVLDNSFGSLVEIR